MGRDGHDEVEVTGAGLALGTLPGQADALPRRHPRRDVDVVATRPVRSGQRDATASAGVRVLERELDLHFLIGAPHRTATAPTEDPAEQVIEVDVPTEDVVARDRRPTFESGRSGAARSPRARGPARAALRGGPQIGIDVVGHLAELRPEAVVLRPRLGVGEHVVGLGDVLEALLRARVLVHVGVVLAGELSVGALDLVRGSGP